MTEIRRNSSITASRQSKANAPILPQETNDDKLPVSRQYLLAMRRFTKLALTRADYAIREIETRLYPEIRHADGCPAVDNDSVHCLSDVYETAHVDGCPAVGALQNRPGEPEKETVSAFCECSKVLIREGCPDRERRMTLRCILEGLVDLTEQAPIRKFGADEVYIFPTRDGYTAMVAEIEFLRERLSELEPEAPARLGAPELQEATT